MIIVRAAHRAGFTQIANATLEDHRLSFKARGLLAYLISRPPGWRTDSNQLAGVGPDGRDAVRTGMQELVDAGYLQRRKQQDEAGRWSTVVEVHEATDAGLPDAGKSASTDAGKPDVGKSVPISNKDLALVEGPAGKPVPAGPSERARSHPPTRRSVAAAKPAARDGAGASETLPGMPEPEHREQRRDAGVLTALWVDGYRTRGSGEPLPDLVKRFGASARRTAKGATDDDRQWAALVRAASEAGAEGRLDLGHALVGTPRTSRRVGDVHKWAADEKFGAGYEMTAADLERRAQAGGGR